METPKTSSELARATKMAGQKIFFPVIGKLML